MTDTVPDGARPVARLLVVGAQQRLLLLEAADISTDERFWLTPGGGVEPGETFHDAARRELHEETGLLVEQIGPWVWTRRHRYQWAGRWCDQYERFFVAETREHNIAPMRPDAYVRGYRWWSVPELQTSPERFAPRQLATLAASIVLGKYPDHPIDCGV